jgi:A/G-specific adenine glycosylase
MHFSKLVNWSHSEFNYLPWRKNRTLYSTLVSEIMLQQTTVSTVLNHFDRFMKEYPTPQHLAQATEEQLLISWKGLGYYRRARNLKKACVTICEKHDGEIPLHYETLINIPGIGDYTASAILSIGNDEHIFAIDANLERVLSRLFGLKELKGPKLIKQIKSMSLLPNEFQSFGGRAVNEALMDLGRNYCKANKTTCDLCPLKYKCYALKNNEVLSLPMQIKKDKEKHELELLRVILKKGNDFLVYKKKDTEWLHGQYEVPTFILKTTDQDLNQYPKIKGDFSALPEFKTAITKYTIKNKVLWVNEVEFKKLGLKIDDYEWGKINLSTASSKAIKL